MKYNQLLHSGCVSILLCLTCLSCHNHKVQVLKFYEADSMVVVRLETISDTLHMLHADIFFENKKIQSSSVRLPYATYQFQVGDIDNDGHTDIGVGVIKRTFYDPVNRKRPFFFKLYKGYLRPLWYGSRLSQPLEDFSIKKIKNRTVLQSIEMEQNGNFLAAQYVWNGFGFRLEKYLARNLNHHAAIALIQIKNTL